MASDDGMTLSGGAVGAVTYWEGLRFEEELGFLCKRTHVARAMSELFEE